MMSSNVIPRVAKTVLLKMAYCILLLAKSNTLALHNSDEVSSDAERETSNSAAASARLRTKNLLIGDTAGLKFALNCQQGKVRGQQFGCYRQTGIMVAGHHQAK